MNKEESDQFIKYLQIARDSNTETVGTIIAFLLQGNFDTGISEKNDTRLDTAIARQERRNETRARRLPCRVHHASARLARCDQ